VCGRRTLDVDGEILVLIKPLTTQFDLSFPFSCEWRRVDVW
jgi:hypothetical protein